MSVSQLVYALAGGLLGVALTVWTQRYRQRRRRRRQLDRSEHQRIVGWIPELLQEEDTVIIKATARTGRHRYVDEPNKRG